MSNEYVLDESNPLRLKRAKIDQDDEEKDVEEQLLEQDIGGNKKRKYTKDSKIDTTQYNDDSSDEDYEGDGAAKLDDEKDDSDSDMFASDGEDEKEATTAKIKKPKVEFLDVKQFEKELNVGQDELKLKSQEDEDESFDEEEEEELLKADQEYYIDQENVSSSKRPPRKEPKLDGFNLKQEQSEGRFDVDGNFIRAGDDDSGEEEDNKWLSGVKKKDIKEAKLAQEKREKLQKERRRNKEALSTEELLFSLINSLQPVESPMEALQRLNKGKPKKKSKKQEPTKEEKEIEEVRKSTVIKITEYCESLLESGISDVYELEKEDLMQKYKEESGKQYVRPKTQDEETKQTPENHVSKQWEFRWVGDDNVHGPYGAREMEYWKGNYFQDKVDVRELGQSDFVHITQVPHF